MTDSSGVPSELVEYLLFKGDDPPMAEDDDEDEDAALDDERARVRGYE